MISVAASGLSQWSQCCDTLASTDSRVIRAESLGQFNTVAVLLFYFEYHVISIGYRISTQNYTQPNSHPLTHESHLTELTSFFLVEFTGSSIFQVKWRNTVQKLAPVFGPTSAKSHRLCDPGPTRICWGTWSSSDMYLRLTLSWSISKYLVHKWFNWFGFLKTEADKRSGKQPLPTSSSFYVFNLKE